MLEITSVGARVLVAFESTAGTRPAGTMATSATLAEGVWFNLPNVNEAPEQDMSAETIDVSDITDTVTRYVQGRQDPGGDQALTLNHTDSVIGIWENLVATANTKIASSKRLWFCYYFPNAAKAYYWCGMPLALGTSGIKQNELDTMPAHVVLTGWEGWAEKPTFAASQTTIYDFPAAT